MALGDVAVYVALLLALAGIATSLARLFRRDERAARASRWLTVALLALVTLVLAYLYAAFITSDVSIDYVWRYTREGHPLKYRLAGVLAGMEGSLLFWVWVAIVPWAYEELTWRRRNLGQDLVDWTRVGVLSVVAVLLYVLSMHDILRPTPADALLAYPDGYGLSPLLQTDLMVVHPPVVFVAYGLLVIPLAAALAHLITGDRGWTRISMWWGRAGWLFLTLGIGIGGLWAYVVLGWGGYWGWDPVETSSLLPWLLLTGFLHAQLMNKRRGEYPIMAPVLGALSFALVVFATFATRAGGLWVSVHTFGSADTGVSSWDRLADILGGSGTVATYLALIIGIVAVTAALAWRASRRRPREEERYYSLGDLISDEMLTFATVTMLAVTTLVTLVILVGGVNGVGPDDFHGPVGLLAVVGMALLLVCMVWRDLGRRRVALLALGALCASGLGALAFRDDVFVAATVPVLAVALAGAAYRAVRSWSRKRPWASLGLVSAHLVHLAVVMVLVGYVGSTFLSEERSASLEVGGAGEDIAGYTLKATDLETRSDSVFVTVDVARGGRDLGTERPGAVLMDGKVRSEIQVLPRALEDVYLIYERSTSANGTDTVDLTVKVLPMMSVLWGGLCLMVGAITLRVIVERTAARREATAAGEGAEAARPRGRKGRRGKGPRRQAADDGRYERQVEEELARLEEKGD